MSDVIDLETHKPTPKLGSEKENSEVSRLMENRRRVQKALKEIGQGRSPTSGIVDGTSPSYWIIRTESEAYMEDQVDDEHSLEDRSSIDQYQLWRHRGGRGSMLRLRADPGTVFSSHVAVRLVDANTGNSCVGLNFLVPDQPPKSKRKRPKKVPDDEMKRKRRFMVVEDGLSRDPEKLLQRLERWRVVGLDITLLRRILKEAPTLIVMPEAGIDMAFW